MTWSRIARRIRVPLGFAFAVLYFWLARPTWFSIAIGAVISLMGVAIRAAASGHITKNAALTTTGPYAHTRNPLYLGSLVIAAGFAVASRSWRVVLAVAILFFAIYVPVIRSEEEFLRSKFPEFDDYARRVPRLLPRLKTTSNQQATTDAQCPTPNNQGTFSRERYLHHREYNALLGTLLMIAALVAKLVWVR
ncbi:MAG: methyltransferase family protein [Terriglobales bacterium]